MSERPQGENRPDWTRRPIVDTRRGCRPVGHVGTLSARAAPPTQPGSIHSPFDCRGLGVGVPGHRRHPPLARRDRPGHRLPGGSREGYQDFRPRLPDAGHPRIASRWPIPVAPIASCCRPPAALPEPPANRPARPTPAARPGRSRIASPGPTPAARPGPPADRAVPPTPAARPGRARGRPTPPQTPAADSGRATPVARAAADRSRDHQPRRVGRQPPPAPSTCLCAFTRRHLGIVPAAQWDHGHTAAGTAAASGWNTRSPRVGGWAKADRRQAARRGAGSFGRPPPADFWPGAAPKNETDFRIS